MRELENFREYTNTSNLNAIKEGAILLTPDERNQIEEIIPKIIDVISAEPLPMGGEKFIDSIEYVFADETAGTKIKKATLNSDFSITINILVKIVVIIEFGI